MVLAYRLWHMAYGNSFFTLMAGLLLIDLSAIAIGYPLFAKSGYHTLSETPLLQFLFHLYSRLPMPHSWSDLPD